MLPAVPWIEPIDSAISEFRNFLIRLYGFTDSATLASALAGRLSSPTQFAGVRESDGMEVGMVA